MPPLPFVPEKWCKQADAPRSLNPLAQAKAAGHRPIHRCCDRENVFLPVKSIEDHAAAKVCSN